MKVKLENTKDKCRQNRPECNLYDDHAMRRYIKRAMTDLERERFDLHVKKCNHCLKSLRQCHIEIEAEKDAAFKAKEEALMDKLDKRDARK